MKEIIYNKLVRDKIPDIIKKNNKTPVTHIASIEEAKELLYHKLLEELNEFKETPNEEELADMLEVIHAIGELHHIDMESIYQYKNKKSDERGGFLKRIVLEKVISK